MLMLTLNSIMDFKIYHPIDFNEGQFLKVSDSHWAYTAIFKLGRLFNMLKIVSLSNINH